MGIAETTGRPLHGTQYSPYRGRGRGIRNHFRGAMRGGHPRASMKLDNRPKKLLVKGVQDDGMQTLRDWYEVRYALAAEANLNHPCRLLANWSRRKNLQATVSS